ncbi:MAG: hypothetical protein ACPLSJ_00310 [Thermosulfidibacteraceae bacterium]|jgi:chromosome segregation ATPase
MKKESIEKTIQKIAEKGKIAANIAQLNFEKLSIERKIGKLHSRLGERINYLFKTGEDIKEDEIVKGIIEEIRSLETKMSKVESKIKELKEKLSEREEKTEEKAVSEGENEEEE